MSCTPSIGQARREREREAHRRSILEAAERVFAARGYEEATVEAIAHEAEFATGTLYNFFAGKEELFLAVADRILDDMIARFEQEVAPFADDPRAAIVNYVGLRLDEIRRHEAFMHVFHPKGRPQCAAEAAPPDIARQRKFKAHLARVHGIFAAGIRQGVLRAAVAPADYAGIVEGSLRFFLHAWAREGLALTHKQGVDRLSGSLLPLLWTDPQPLTPSKP